MYMHVNSHIHVCSDTLFFQQPLLFRNKSHSTFPLYSTLTDVFLDEAKNLDSCKGMKFDPPSNIGYKPYLDALEANGRTINTTVADGNCLYRSISKSLIGTEFYHFLVQTVILGFIYMNTQIFEPHIRQVGCPLPI